MFVRTNSTPWESTNQSDYKDSIVFIEDTEQIYSNGIYYGGKTGNRLFSEKIEFTEGTITIDPSKFYFCNEPLSELDITLTGDSTKMNTYFVEFLCDDTCVILPSNIKWENEIVPDFTKTAIMTVKIQDDTIYLVDCRSVYYVSYSAPRRTQPNRTDAFGSNIIGVNDYMFILDGPATEIKEGAFEGNQDLISITIPNTVKRIGSKAFSGCSNLQDMEYEGNSKDWNNIELGEDWNEGTEVESVESADGDLYLEPYVTFIALEDNSSIGLNQLSTYQTLEYSRDRSNWSNMNTSTNISLNNGDKVYVRGVLRMNNTTSKYTQFKMIGKISASGNCNAIWNYQDLNAPLKKCCGYLMFQYCKSLTTAPELPATILADYCYNSMFQNCTSLVTAPELPATELADYCYNSMFQNCTSLVTAPELPATTLAPYCYREMFSNCTSLTTAPELPATVLAKGCYYSMFSGCASLVTAPMLPATTLADSCYGYMFHGCTSLTAAPVLPATTLAEGCYSSMFHNCSSLVAAPELPATTLTRNCYNFMFASCKSLTTVPELPATTLFDYCYLYMFGDCTKLNHIKCLATNKSATNCTNDWVYGVAETGTFIKHPDMNDWSTGSSGIPRGWKVENAEI
jgi:hypothetical protein